MIAGLFVLEAFLFLSDRFRWFGFDHHKGWAVLIALASVVTVIVLVVAWTLLVAVLRWRMQFSLRSVLALTVAAALACSWLAMEMKKAKEQKIVGETITELGGRVEFDYEEEHPFCKPRGLGPRAWAWLRELFGDDFFANVTMIDCGDSKLADASLTRLDFKRLSQLRSLDLGNTHVTDDGLRSLGGATQLQELHLTGTNVTDAGLRHVVGLARLQFLDVSKTKVTDAGLEDVKELFQLQSLSLDGTEITDAGLVCLRSLTQLQFLYLDGTKVTDVGLIDLRALTQLQTLSLDDTGITGAGLKHLRGLPYLQELRAFHRRYERGDEEGIARNVFGHRQIPTTNPRPLNTHVPTRHP
jgi:hypothetical protein